MDNPDELLATMKAEVVVMDSQDEARANTKLVLARHYLAEAVRDYSVPPPIFDDCVVSVAVDLYNAKNAQLGVMNVTDGQMEPFRVSTDPLRSAWPKLNAAGIPVGGFSIR
jgi:hypothetical protein